ncbi:MAG: hypothetical protein EDM75_10500 [Chlorobiota bacterium]|nr:MAG: hypothetical protein EDM75_10500 [Chlorobiota bacterium]
MNKLQLMAQAELARRKRQQERQAIEEKRLAVYQRDPLLYFEERLGIRRETIDWTMIPEYRDHKWDGTPNPFMAIVEGLMENRWVGVESATGTGKTHFGALVVLWFLECFRNSVVVTTAPKQDQLTLHIWKEISKLYPKFGKGEYTSLKLRMNPGKDDWLAVGFVAGIKANEESNTKAQGFHAEHMLIILEETPGVPLPIINAFENTSVAPHNLILAFGNPDHQLDSLHRFCMMPKVKHVRISAYDHPNLVLGNPMFIPGATSQEGVNRIISKFGDGSPMALSRTRGISPEQPSDALIRIEWIMQAVENFKIREPENLSLPGEWALGVDVANSEMGDKAAITMGIGAVCLSCEDFQCPDANQLGHQVYRLIKEKGINEKRVGVDGVGVGAGTVNTLREYGLRWKGINLQGGASPVKLHGKAEQFNNLRSQMWWQAREDLRNGEIAMPNDTELIADLSAPKFETNNKVIIVEGKEEIKKRLGRSPNKGDSFVYWNWVRVKRGGLGEARPVAGIGF